MSQLSLFSKPEERIEIPPRRELDFMAGRLGYKRTGRVKKFELFFSIMLHIGIKFAKAEIASENNQLEPFIEHDIASFWLCNEDAFWSLTIDQRP